MQGQRSLDPELVEPIEDPEYLIRRAQRSATMVENQQMTRPLREYFVPNTYTPASCITRPDVGANHFEIKASVIQMLHSFYGLSNEDPYRHLDEFLEICSTVRINNFGDDALKLTLFSFSLKDKAKHWLKALETVRITTWVGMQREFLKKYFPIRKTNQFRKVITSFSHIEGEHFHETWERMKDLLRKCPTTRCPVGNWCSISMTVLLRRTVKWLIRLMGALLCSRVRMRRGLYLRP